MQYNLTGKRYTEIKYVKNGTTEVVKDHWTRASPNKEWWTGRTIFVAHHFGEQKDTSVDPIPMRELSRKERKQLDREIPWREILKRGPGVVEAFCEALRK